VEIFREGCRATSFISILSWLWARRAGPRRPRSGPTPLIKASHETAHEIRAAYAALGGALTVRAAFGQRHHEIEAMNTEHVRSLDEIEGLKALIVTIVNERDEAVAALAAGREALASSRALLAETEQSTGVLQATLAERDGARWPRYRSVPTSSPPRFNPRKRSWRNVTMTCCAQNGNSPVETLRP
jgi:hypothetical protein